MRRIILRFGENRVAMKSIINLASAMELSFSIISLENLPWKRDCSILYISSILDIIQSST